MKITLTMKMPDGSVWGVPVSEIADDRAEFYKGDFGGSIHRSLDEDTLPLFREDEYEITDWAVNQMNWSDFKGANRVSAGPALTPQDFQNAWLSAEKELI